MKKKIITCSIIALYIILSLNTVMAGLVLTKHDSLTVNEQRVVEGVADRIFNILFFEKNCDAVLQNIVLEKIKEKKKVYEYDDAWSSYKKFHMYATLEREFLTRALDCNIEIIADDFFIDTFPGVDTPQPFETKKGTFHYMLGADIEIRTSTSYIYFYHKNTLINTVNKKFKNDVSTIHEILGKKQIDHDDILNDTEANTKIGLYSARYLDSFYKDPNYIHFTKVDDNGTRSFIYYVKGDKWFDLGFGLVKEFGILDSERFYILTVDAYANVEMRDATGVYILDSIKETKSYVGSLFTIGELERFHYNERNATLYISIRNHNGSSDSKYFVISNY